MFGVGGDFQYVRNGEARVKVVEVPVSNTEVGNTSTQSTGLMRTRKVVVNTPPPPPPSPTEDAEAAKQPQSQSQPPLNPTTLPPISHLKVVGARTIVGPYIKTVKGTRGAEAIVSVQEGMWEVRRGVKVDGGERRKAQVRRKRLLEERKTGRK